MGTEGASRSAHQISSHQLSSPLAKQSGASLLEVSNCDVHPQDRMEGASGELQACPSDLGAGEDCGVDYLECIQDNRLIRQS